MLRVERIHRYPIKGLSAEAMVRVGLRRGEAIPLDRHFAIAHGAAATRGETIEWMPKTSFANLSRHERLAQLETALDPATALLSIRRNGKPVARGRLDDRVGRAVIEDFLAAFLKDDVRGKPKLVRAREGIVLTDCSEPMISLLNLASVRDLARVAGPAAEARRFRANIQFDGGVPWEEFSWVGREITLGGARLEVVHRIGRCAATNVNPATAVRDANMLAALQRGFGHTDMGVYARTVADGEVAVGDTIMPPAPVV